MTFTSIMFILFTLAIGSIVSAAAINSYLPVQYECPDDVVWNTALEGRL